MCFVFVFLFFCRFWVVFNDYRFSFCCCCCGCCLVVCCLMPLGALPAGQSNRIVARDATRWGALQGAWPCSPSTAPCFPPLDDPLPTVHPAPLSTIPTSPPNPPKMSVPLAPPPAKEGHTNPSPFNRRHHTHSHRDVTCLTADLSQFPPPHPPACRRRRRRPPPRRLVK